MKKRRLGKTGLMVPEVCLGTMTFGSQADEKTSFEIMDRSLDAGVDFLDVAEIYPVPPDPKWAGQSEEIVGKWMKDRAHAPNVNAYDCELGGKGCFSPKGRRHVMSGYYPPP